MKRRTLKVGELVRVVTPYEHHINVGLKIGMIGKVIEDSTVPYVEFPGLENERIAVSCYEVEIYNKKEFYTNRNCLALRL